MKKVITLMVTLVMVAAMAVPAWAADFTPSVAGKAAPAIMGAVDGYGNPIDMDAITITPFGEKDGADAVISEALERAFKLIEEAEDLTALVPKEKLEEALAKLTDEKLDLKDLVVRDLFDVTVPEGTKFPVTLTYDLKIKADEWVMVLHNVKGDEWEVIDPDKVKNNGDGTLTVVHDSLSPIAFVVKAEGAKTTETAATAKPAEPEETGGHTSTILIVLAVIAAIAAAFFFARSKKAKGNEKN